MRTLIVSDVHSNIVALDAVLAVAGDAGPIDQVWCLGDIVGYGPWPVATVRRLRSLDAVCICGNHDAGAIGRLPLDDFNGAAGIACRWNGEQLDDESRDFLSNLPLTVERDGFTLVHGTPANPLWEYLYGYAVARQAWDDASTGDILVGHTHLQFTVESDSRDFALAGSEGRTVRRGSANLIVNPGSVGQPRNGDPRACYAVYDDQANEVALRRVAYDVAATQRAMGGREPAAIAHLAVGAREMMAAPTPWGPFEPLTPPQRVVLAAMCYNLNE